MRGAGARPTTPIAGTRRATSRSRSASRRAGAPRIALGPITGAPVAPRRRCITSDAASLRAVFAGLRRASHGATETPLPEDAALFGLVVHLQRSAPTAALMVWLGLAIGARRGELAALRWSDIDLVAGTVSIDKSVDTRTQADKSTKTKGTRVVPVGEQVAVALGAERDRRRAMAGALWSESWPVFCTARDPSRRPH